MGQHDESDDEHTGNENDNNNETNDENGKTTQIKRFIISPAPPEVIEVSPEPNNEQSPSQSHSQSPQKQQPKLENIDAKSEEIVAEKWTAPNEPKSKWSENECSQWVGSLGDKYKQYVDAFVENGVDGNLLNEVTDEDLKDIVKLGLHRKKILTAWNKLQQSDD